MHDDHKKHKNHHGHGSLDHSEHHHHMVKDFRKRFWISLGITLPILILSPIIREILGHEFSFDFDKDILFGLSTLVYFYGGYHFYRAYSMN